MAPPRDAGEWGRLGPLLGELAGGDPAANAHAVAAVLEGALRGAGGEPAQQLAALAVLEALATNSSAFRHGCGTGPGSVTERLADAVREVAETPLSPRQSSKARKIFARKKPAPQEVSGRRSQSAKLVLQSFEARALQAHTRGTAAPFYEAFAQARPTARSWAAAAAASAAATPAPDPVSTPQAPLQVTPRMLPPSPEASKHGEASARKPEKGCADVLGRKESREGARSDRKGPGEPPGVPLAATASPRVRRGGYSSKAEAPAGKRARLVGSPRFSAEAVHEERSEAPKTEGIEDGGGTSERETAEAEGHAPANLSPAGAESVAPGEDLDALCRYLQALGGEAGRQPAPGSGAFRDNSDRAGRLKQLISERQRIRGALERLSGVLEALQSIESRARAARWAAAAGAQILSGTPSPRRGALAAACLENI